MNPIVKNIALKLCETAPACLLEILFETLIKTWNEYVREFNLPFKRIDIADLMGVTMDRENSRMNNSRNTYPNDASKIVSSGGISTGPDEQTFFDYFRQHIQSSNYQPSLNITSNGISLEADRNQLLNLATDIFSESQSIKVEEKKDSLSCEVVEDISWIDFTDAKDLNPYSDEVSNCVKEHVAASKDSEFKHEASSVDFLESRTVHDTKPADATMINDLKPDVAVSENVSIPEINHGIGNTPNQITFLESIYETLPKLAENDNSTPYNVITSKLHPQINDILTLQQELNIKGNKDRYAWNAPDAVKPDVSLKQDVVLFEDTPTSKEKYLLKLHSKAVKAESPKNEGGQTELSKEGEKDLIDLRLPIDENSIDCKTQVLKQKQTELGELGEKDFLVFTSSTDEYSNECEGQVFKQGTHEVSDKEVHIIKDKFVGDRDIDNGYQDLDFSVGCTNNATDEITDNNERFDYHLYESDFFENLLNFKQFNTEDIEKEWQEPNWSLLEGGENDLTLDRALSFSNLRNETSENINGIIDLLQVFNENNTATEDKISENGIIDLLQVFNENNTATEDKISGNGIIDLLQVFNENNTATEDKISENGIIDLLQVFNENNTATEDKISKNELTLPEGFQKAIANENNLLGDLVEQYFKEANIDPVSIVQADTEKQTENLKNRMNRSAAELLFEFESLPNKRQEPLGTDSSTKQKSREIITGKKEQVNDSKREVMELENNEIEIANELEGVSIDKRKGDMETKKGLTYNKYCIRPIKNRPLNTSHKGINPFPDSQRLKTETEQCVRIKYIYRNAPRIHREALKQKEDNSNNLNSPENGRMHEAIGKEVRQSSVKYPSRRMTIKASYKSDGREHVKTQRKVPQVRSKQMTDGNKSPVPSSDINQESVSIGKINSKNYNRPLKKPLYSRKIINKALSKRPCKPSITLVSDIQEKIGEGSSQNNHFSNTQNVQNRRAAVIGSCSKCIELSPLEIARRNLINRNILLPEHCLDLRQKFIRTRRASKSVERPKRSQRLTEMTREKRPNKKISFIENDKNFLYDPTKSVAENFSKAVTSEISKKEESAVGKDNFVGVANCEKQDEKLNENLGDAEGYTNLGFVDVPLFDCLPDFESDPPIANVANFGEADQLLTSSPTPRVAQDPNLSERLSAVSRRMEGNMRRWMKYGVMARKGISFKKMRAVMSRK